ncbi:hypothetical protein C8F01DRAFT_1124468 [Mycena amicta]|nr:hypothetical protein C8F01DRAFT_1124468 [Mycena amicta]
MAPSAIAASSCMALGFFALEGATRLPNPDDATRQGLHCSYNTAVKTNARNIFLAATLRVYTPPSTAPFSDGTIAYVVAKVYAPAGHHALIELDALQIVPVPGDPMLSASYQASIPDISTFFVGAGQVLSTASVPSGAKGFVLTTSEHIARNRRPFPLMCIFPPGPRWANTHVPAALTCVEFLGVLADQRLPDGTLQLDLENFAPNLGPTTAAQVAVPPSTPQGAKYQSKPTVFSPSAGGALTQGTVTYQSSPSTPSQPIASGSHLAMQPMTSFAQTLATHTPSKKPLPKRAKHSESSSPAVQSSFHTDDGEDEADEAEELPEEEPAEEPVKLGKGQRKRKARVVD